MKNGAIFSECRKYRYVLSRVWDEHKPKAMCIGLNPSTANEDNDDQTILNLRKILDHLGYGGFIMTNLFALISSKPDALRVCPDPVFENDHYLKAARANSQDVIFCWGDFPMAGYRAKIIKKMFPDGKCFGKNKSGSPMHPLALMYNGTVKTPILKPYN